MPNKFYLDDYLETDFFGKKLFNHQLNFLNSKYVQRIFFQGKIKNKKKKFKNIEILDPVKKEELLKLKKFKNHNIIFVNLIYLSKDQNCIKKILELDKNNKAKSTIYVKNCDEFFALISNKNQATKNKKIYLDYYDFFKINCLTDIPLAEKKFKVSVLKNKNYYYSKRYLKYSNKKLSIYKHLDPDGKYRNTFQLKYRKDRIDFFSNELKYINKTIGNKKRLNYLDLGCGQGFVTSAIRKPIKKYGLEIDPDCIKFIKEQKYFDVVKSEKLTNSTFKDNFFDIINFSHVIEHVPNPVELLEICYKILKPKGHLILGAPNFNSACSKRYGKKFRMLHDITHISLFEDFKLRELCMDIGFKVNNIDYPYFENKKFFNKKELLKILDKNTKFSPAFYGNVMTLYCTK